MSRIRIVVAAALVVALALAGWQVFLRPRPTEATNAAPAFAATTYRGQLPVKFPDDYGGSWIWLMFSGKD